MGFVLFKMFFVVLFETSARIDMSLHSDIVS